MKALRIEIDLATCIRCGHCAQVCPMAILLQNPENKEISVVRPESCIICGQCAAICPTSALEHSDFPPEKLHKIAKEELPTADALELLIRARRSNRAFTDKEIPYGLLVRILQAAHRAPTGSNSQMVEFTLVKSPEKLREISEYTCKIFEIGIRAMKEAAKSIGDGQPDKRILDTIAKIEAVATHPELVLRKATAAIFFHSPQIIHNGVEIGRASRRERVLTLG